MVHIISGFTVGPDIIYTGVMMSNVRSVLCQECKTLVPLYFYAGADIYTCSSCGHSNVFVTYSDWLECEELVKEADIEQEKLYKQDSKKDWHPKLGWGQWKYWRTEDAPLGSLGHWEFWKVGFLDGRG